LSGEHTIRRARFPSFARVEIAEAPPPPAAAIEAAARAREAARREGLAQGREEGRAAALAEWGPRLAALAAALEQAAATTAAERGQLAADLAETLPAIAVRIARKVIERELAVGEHAVRAAIEPVVRRLAHSAATAVTVAPDVAAALEAWRGESGALAGVTIRADGTLRRGDWIVETEAGFLDGRLATQLDEAARVLTEPER
jgi:flagellar assembly protein FliH